MTLSINVKNVLKTIVKTAPTENVKNAYPASIYHLENVSIHVNKELSTLVEIVYLALKEPKLVKTKK